MIAARRRIQVVTAPVIDHVLAVAVFRRQPLTPIERVVGTSSTLVAALVTVIAAIRLAALIVVIATIRLAVLIIVIAAIRLPALIVAPLIIVAVLIIIALLVIVALLIVALRGPVTFLAERQATRE